MLSLKDILIAFLIILLMCGVFSIFYYGYLINKVKKKGLILDKKYYSDFLFKIVPKDKIFEFQRNSDLSIENVNFNSEDFESKDFINLVVKSLEDT